MSLAGARWGRRGFPVPSFSVRASGLLLVPLDIWPPSFGETAVGLAHAEKRKSEVAPGVAVRGMELERKVGAWDPEPLCFRADLVQSLWGPPPLPAQFCLLQLHSAPSRSHTTSKSGRGWIKTHPLPNTLPSGLHFSA